MITTSKDLLFVTLAACAGIFTVFLCWMMYYVIKLFRQTTGMVEKFEKGMDAMTNFFELAKSKISTFGTVIGVVAQAAEKIIEKVWETKQGKKK